uniref:Unclassified n=1 Tax=Fusarium pseudograminearum CS3427 TaxID=1318457 RepID=W1I935_FUSPS|nr:unclassified [Fusarium pseudograminearum CS3427]CDX48455.1 unclassified [Fusarium pseudograminearum CS3427]
MIFHIPTGSEISKLYLGTSMRRIFELADPELRPRRERLRLQQARDMDMKIANGASSQSRKIFSGFWLLIPEGYWAGIRGGVIFVTRRDFVYASSKINNFILELA